MSFVMGECVVVDMLKFNTVFLFVFFPAIGSTLFVCFQDGSHCRQRSFPCLWPGVFRNSSHRAESSHHGPKLCTRQEGGFV